MHSSLSVCVGKKCRSLGSDDVYDHIECEIKRHDCPVLKLVDSVDLNIKLCSKYCDDGPLVFWNDKIFLKMNEERSTKLLQAIYAHDFDSINLLSPVSSDVSP